MPPRIAKLVGYGAFGAIALFVVIFLLVFFVTLPRSAPGMTTVLDVVTWIAVGLMVLALAALHVVIARQLIYIGRGGGPRRA